MIDMKRLHLIIIIASIILLVSVVSGYPLGILESIKSGKFAELQTRKEPAGAIYEYSKPTPTYVIQLKTIQFKPEELTYNEVVYVIDTDAVYYLVQWKSFSLIDYGLMNLYNISNMGYIHNDTYIIKIPQDTQPTLLYNSIRWIGIWQPEWKISSGLKNYIDSLESNATIGIVIEFFESIGENQINEIKKLSESTVGFENDIGIIEIKKFKINEITNLSFVKWIEPRSVPSISPIIGPLIRINVNLLLS